MFTLLSKLTITKRLALIVAVSVLSIAAVLAVEGIQLRNQLLDDKREKTRELVEAAHSIIAHYHSLEEKGELDSAPAQRQALNALKDMRYGNKEYFWINDLTPRMVMHPYKPELDGKNLSEAKDPNGKRLFVEMVRAAAGTTGGFVDYSWPKPGQDKSVPKLSYVKEYKPWGWIVGSGIYIDDVDAATREMLLDSVLTGGSITLILVIFSVVLARSITLPLRRTVMALSEAAIGDGDLTRRLNDSGHNETAELGRAFNTFVAKIQNMLTSIAASSDHLADTASVVTSVSISTSRLVSRQQSETDQVATAVTEMSQTALSVAENAARAADAVHSVEEQAKEGTRVINSNRESIAALNDTVAKAGARIERLSSESERIGAILDTIREIAGQTNLLALNAAIEAARAGEQGRGFAVVADEVRTLAASTATATTEIEEMIRSLQQGAAEAAKAMEEGQIGAQESVKSAESAYRTLVAIREAIATIDDMNTQIASAAQEQAAVAEEITKHVVSITSIACETAEGAVRTEESAAAMDNHVNKLSQRLKDFRLS